MESMKTHWKHINLKTLGWMMADKIECWVKMILEFNRIAEKMKNSRTQRPYASPFLCPQAQSSLHEASCAFPDLWYLEVQPQSLNCFELQQTDITSSPSCLLNSYFSSRFLFRPWCQTGFFLPMLAKSISSAWAQMCCSMSQVLRWQYKQCMFYQV